MRFLIIIGILFCSVSASSQTLKRQKNITRMGIPYGNYSGIVHIKGNQYAVVSDKDNADGFHFFDIDINTKKGKIKSVRRYEPEKSKENEERAKLLQLKQRDIEGICYRASSNTLYISGEADQQILEYSFDGIPTGKCLNIPDIFSRANITTNRGFESLSYNGTTKTFWTTTENVLPADEKTNPYTIRLQSFDDNLQPLHQYAYRMDNPLNNKKSRRFVHGVPDILALDDGSLIIMEREVHVTPKYLGSYCIIKLYLIHPSEEYAIDGNDISRTKVLKKTMLTMFETTLKIGKMNFANYEGMCIGPKLDDGRQTILLINDSQNGEGNKLYRAKDYVKLIIFDQYFPPAHNIK